MFATIRRYEGVDQNRTTELTSKVNETLMPKLNKLPGFKGYYLIDAGNGVFSSLGLFETPEQGTESTSSSPPGSARRSSRRFSPTSPRSRAARSLLAAATAFSRPRSPTATDSKEGLREPGPPLVSTRRAAQMTALESIAGPAA